MTPAELTHNLPTTALAFRGYNVTNLGRTPELLAHPVYGETVERHLTLASQAASEQLKRPIDLASRVRRKEETSLETYGEAVALLLAVEAAQLEILAGKFAVPYRQARFSFGYSLGEIAALVAGGVFETSEAMKVPLLLSADCVALAHDVTLGVLFTRASELPANDVRRVCLMVNREGNGIVGISTYLTPNSMLILGQGDALDRFLALAKEELKVKFHLRKNDSRWPPLHTPIIWERHISDRAAQAMHTLQMSLVAPQPKVMSLVTGDFSYTDTNARKLLHEWVDHPQLLWNVIDHTLADGITTVIHVGPDPNLLPATFRRLSENVQGQLDASLGLRTLSAATQKRRWLRQMLPQRVALLRAPYVRHIILEDWLLAQPAR